jgi:hypothetical protein
MASARKPVRIPISSKPVTKLRILARKQHTSLPNDVYLDLDLVRDIERVPDPAEPRSTSTVIPIPNCLPDVAKPLEYVRKKVAQAINDGYAYAEHVAIRFDPHPAIYKKRVIEKMRDSLHIAVGSLTFFDWNEELFESVAKECLELGYLAVFLDRHYRDVHCMDAYQIQVAHLELIVDWSADPDIKPGFHKRNVVCHC